MTKDDSSTSEPGGRGASGWLSRYGLALLAGGLAFVLAAPIRRSIRPYLLPEVFLAAVGVSAWYGGLGPGVLACLIIGAGGAYFLLPPFRSLATGDVSSLVLFGLCLLAAVTVGLLGRTARAARARAAASARAVEREQRLVALLAEASRLLGVSIEYEAALAAVANLVVSFVADLCVIDLVDEDGKVRRVAREAARPALREWPLDLPSPLGSEAADPLRSGEPVLVAAVPDLAVTSAIGVPLVARGRTLGAMYLLRAEPHRHYDAADVGVAEDLAARCATAIDNGRLYRAAQAEIAERRTVEHRLRVNEERLALAVQAAHMGTWDWNLETGEFLINWPERAAASGPGEKPIGGGFEEFLTHVHPEDRPRVSEVVARAIEDASEYEVEMRVFWPDGPLRWVTAKGRVVCDEQGKAVRVIGVPMDITARKRADQRLAVQYEITRTLAGCATLEEAAPRILRTVCECLGWVHGGLWRVDPVARVLRCVETWNVPSVPLAEFEALSRETSFPLGLGLPGRVWGRGEPVWIPDVMQDANFPRATVAAREGLHGAFGFPIRNGDEVVGVLEFFSPSIVAPDTELLTMIGTIGTQIGQFMQRRRVEDERVQLLSRVQAAHAEARAAERRAAFLAEASGVLSTSLERPETLDALARLAVPALGDWCTVDLLDADGSIRRAAAAHVDPARGELLRTVFDRYPPDAHHAFRDVITTGRSALLANVPETTLLGMAFDAEHMALVRQLQIRSFMLVPMMARGRVLGAIAFASGTPGRYGAADLTLAEDLANRAALAVDNARLYQTAQEETRRKDEFLAMLGHELRNPLAAIDGATRVLGRVGAMSEHAVRQRAIIDRQTRQLVRLVDDMLDVSRVVSDKIVLQRAPIDLNEIAERCLEAIGPRIEERRHEAVFSPASERVVVSGDRARLEQVVLNLLDNAVKYTPPGGRIELSIERIDAEVVLRVRDSGIGMTGDLLPRVFDMFAQAERTLDRAQGGLGLGLTLVRRLVEQHGGSVAASSGGPGRGSEFVVSLPVLEDAVPAVPAASRDSGPTLSRHHILLVEDNADGREALRTLLELSGHRVDVAVDGPSGIELARRAQPEVALIDIGLPGLDGYQVAAALRADEGSRIRLVALTGYGQAEDRRRALAAGFDAHLVKPVEPEELVRVLEELTAAGTA